jgi:Sulfotransferase domain
MTANESTDHDEIKADETSYRPCSPLPEMPLLPITSPQTVLACRNLAVSDHHDIFVCSYPKSGTTWTQNLVVRLLAAWAEMELPPDWHLSHSAPFYEVNQYWKADGQRIPPQTPIIGTNSSGISIAYRVFNTHLRPHQLPENAKCVYVMRDAMDVMVSFYHHFINMSNDDGGYSGTAEIFCHDFLHGTIAYGAWEDHIEAWLAESETLNSSTNMLLLHYHEMKQDLSKEATRLAKFLGVPEVDINRVLAIALPACTFDAMKHERWRYTPQSVSWKKDPQTGQSYDKFVRKGQVGDGNHFVQNTFTVTLHEKWVENQRRARRRWQKVGIGQDIVDKYLKPQVRSSTFIVSKRYSKSQRSSHTLFRSLPFLLSAALWCMFFLIFPAQSALYKPAVSLQTAKVAHLSSSQQINVTSRDVFIIVTSPCNSISTAVAKHLYPANIFWIVICPSSTKDDHERIQRQLQRRMKQRTCNIAFFDPYGTATQIRASAVDCWQTMTQSLSAAVASACTEGTKTENNGLDDCSYFVRGILFNQYGYVDENINNDKREFAATPLAQYKVLSSAVLIETFKDIVMRTAKERSKQDPISSPPFYSNFGMRIIAVGTEAARGLPKMGFLAPTIGTTRASIQAILTSQADFAGATPTSWEHIYAQLSALQVLYFKALASGVWISCQLLDPSFYYWYFGVVSPGMTQESLHVKHVPPSARTLAFRLKMAMCRYILFPLLRKMEIAKTVDEAGRLLAAALIGSSDFAYPNGCFVGAKSGTGGPLCDQTLLEGGKQLVDRERQELTFRVVQEMIK